MYNMTKIYSKLDINDNAIIGRLREKKELDFILNSSDPELFFLYGRRRIGKTFLIHNYCGNKGLYFYFRAEENSDMNFTLSNFYNEIVEVFRNEGIKIEKPKNTNWTDALNFLYEQIKKISKEKNIIILIDEFPWFCTKKSNFLNAFSHFWNKQASNHSNFKILCTGSATSFLVNKVIKNKKGLFARSKSFKMKPFTLSETSKFLNSRKVFFDKPKDIILLYMIFGGIPYYLKEVKNGQSVEEIVNRCFCGNSPILGLEFSDLFEGTFSNYELHTSIINFIKLSKKGKTKKEIYSYLKGKFNSTKNKYNGSQLKTALQDLVQSDLIVEVKSFSFDKRVSGIDQARYKMADEFLMFFSYWLDNNPMISNEDYWSKDSKTRDLSSWSGEVFERVCLNHLHEIFDKMGIHCNIAGYWWKNFDDPESKEIDILVDRDDGLISIVEIKYYEDIYSLDETKTKAIISKKTYFDNYKKNEKSIQHNEERKKKSSNIIFLTAVGINQNNKYKDIPVSNNFSLIDLL